MHRRSAALAVGILTLVSVTGCSAAVPGTQTGVADPSSSSPTTESATSPAPAPPAEAVEPTCENIMSADFTTEWVPVVVGDDPVFSDGIVCRWQADPTVGTDNVLVYGWTPAGDTEWETLVAEFTAETDSPWFVEAGGRGEYLTHQTEYWVRDDEGYGTTYLFTGDAIILAATKAETDDVVGPPPAP